MLKKTLCLALVCLALSGQLVAADDTSLGEITVTGTREGSTPKLA